MSGYDVVRIAVGFLLLLAAGLKGHQLATEPVSGAGILDSRWFLILVVEFEFVFGLWLWGGLCPKWTRWMVLVCFALFSGVSLFKALSGETSCGCFGKVAVNPWYTLLLDIGGLLSLVWWHSTKAEARCRLGSRAFTVRLISMSVAWLLVGLPGGFAMATYVPARLSGDGEFVGESEIVVLEPETWIGHRFPLLERIEITGAVGDGLWIVLLYKSGCSVCCDAALRLERRFPQALIR